MRDTIDMAREAGGRAQQNKNCDVEYLMSADALKAFEALVRADEREACAKVCENWTQTPETTGMELALCATAIRAKVNT
jgi:hypothetical protein